MTLPPWPAEPPACGQVLLRAVEARDAAMAQQLSTDPYVPQTGSLPGNATMQEASDWVERQQGRHAEGTGFSFTIARRTEEFAIGHCGLWLKDLDEERASAGYAVAPSERGRGYAAEALAALTEFGWTVPGVQPDRTIHRTVEHRIDSHRRTRRLCSRREPPGQPSAGRRRTSRHDPVFLGTTGPLQEVGMKLADADMESPSSADGAWFKTIPSTGCRATAPHSSRPHTNRLRAGPMALGDRRRASPSAPSSIRNLASFERLRASGALSGRRNCRGFS